MPREGDDVDVIAISDGEGGEFVLQRNEESDDSSWANVSSDEDSSGGYSSSSSY